jgi:hypothetical protein
MIKKKTIVRFELTRAKPNRFQICPINHSGILSYVLHCVRFELTHPKIVVLETTALDHSANNALKFFKWKFQTIKELLGIEPRLEDSKSSVITIRPQLQLNFDGRYRDRTCDHTINSRALYQLS